MLLNILQNTFGHDSETNKSSAATKLSTITIHRIVLSEIINLTDIKYLKASHNH